MAVSPRKRADGSTAYYIDFTWNGKRVWEHGGKDRREAERLLARRRREVKAGTYVPPKESKAVLFRQYALQWIAGRTNRSAGYERHMLERFVLTRSIADMPIVEIRPSHAKALVKELQATSMAPKYVANVWGMLRTLGRDAVVDEAIAANPFVLPKGTISKRPVKERTPYERDEVMAFFAGKPELTTRMRAFAGLLFLTGLRIGEVCGLVWGDVSGGAITVARQYDGQALKTDRPRIVPLHPMLRELLDEWRAMWRLEHLRAPEADDPILGRIHITHSSAYKLWLKCCVAAEVKNRSAHSTRHTFITMARMAGAPKEVVERITHNARGDIVDRYTHRIWEPMVLAVENIDVDPRRNPPPSSDSSGETGPSGGGNGHLVCSDSLCFPSGQSGSSPTAGALKDAAPAFPSTSASTSDDDLLASNRARRERLRALAELGQDVQGGIELTAALDAAYRIGGGVDARAELEVSLGRAASSLGLADGRRA